MLVVPEVAGETGHGAGEAAAGEDAVEGDEAVGEVDPDETVEEGDGCVSVGCG